MIYYLDGTLEEQHDEFIVLATSGTGYQVFMPSLTQQNLPAISDPLKLYIYHHIREDSQTLFGFETIEDRDFFIQLTSVSGIGPKVGLKILSTLPTQQIIQAIIQGDLVALTSVSGVGKKMAERMVIELKDKLPKVFQSAATMAQNASPTAAIPNDLSQDLSLALRSLGYKSDEIKTALKASAANLSDAMSLEDGIKVLLKHL